MVHKLTTSLLAFCLAFALIGPSLVAGDKKEEGLKWLKYDQALELAKKEGRHVLVDFETKWCGYCKKMAATTYRDSGVVATLNKYFALAKVDGDSYDLIKLSDGEITEKGLTRQYSVTGYPTTWMLEPNGTKIAPVRGYVDSIRFQYILDYIYTNSNDKMSFKEFVEQETLKQGKK